jgi:hypothetical protein
MFSADRHLLSLEPNLFRDVAFLAQTLALTSGSLSAGTLTLDDPVPTGPGAVERGGVALVGRTALEILTVSSSTSLIVSLSRPDPTGPQILPANRAADPVAITSFRPQLAIIHRQLLAMLGINPDAAPAPGIVTEADILNPQDLSLVESLGALHLIYSAAAAALSDTSPQARRAEMYRQRFNEERWRARAEIDLNADGAADATRTLNVSHLVRM